MTKKLNNQSDISCLPKHVAIIMDGNGRWATKRLLPRINGHKNATRALRDSIEFCVENSIQALTLFAFGMDNWQRPSVEVNALMSLFSATLKQEFKTLMQNNIKFSVIGKKENLNNKLRTEILDIEQQTASNTGLQLNVAISYSGKWDIVEACKKVAGLCTQGLIDVSKINEELLSRNLSLAGLPEPDLLIRTSGEFRISNFLLWQLAYSELYFTDVLWPDFTKANFQQALDFFASRQRRFGLTSEQLRLQTKPKTEQEELLV